MIVKLLICLVVLTSCSTPHASISPKNSFTISINQPQSSSRSYLIEINAENFMAQWAELALLYSSPKPLTVVHAKISAVSKKDHAQIHAVLGQCLFKGAQAQWCKIGEGVSSFDKDQHILNVQVNCSEHCQTQLVLGLTQTSWVGNSSPRFLVEAVSTTTPLAARKRQAMFKILGWMAFTLVAVLGAIKFATSVADWVYKKPRDYESYSKED